MAFMGPWWYISSLAAARRYLRGFRSGDLNGSCRKLRETNLTVFGIRITVTVSAIPVPTARHMFRMMEPMVSNGEPTGFIT